MSVNLRQYDPMDLSIKNRVTGEVLTLREYMALSKRQNQPGNLRPLWTFQIEEDRE